MRDIESMKKMFALIGLLITFQVCSCSCHSSENSTSETTTSAGSHLLSSSQRIELIQFVEQLESNSSQDAATVNPCNDFYEYVCGGGRGENRTAPVVVRKRNNLEDFLMNAKKDTLSDSEWKLKEFHESCQLTGSAVVEQLKQSDLYVGVGGWPAVDNATWSKDVNWISVLAEFDSIIGINYFFNHKIEIQNNKRVVELRPSLRVKYSVEEFKDAVRKTATSYGLQAELVAVVANECAKFENDRREIIGLNLTKANLELTYTEFKLKYENITWDVYFRRMLGKSLKETDVILMKETPTMEEIFRLLAATESRVLLNYVWARYLNGKSPPTNCKSMLHEYFGPVLHSIRQRPYVNKLEVMEMLTEIGNTFRRLIAPSIWIDEISQENTRKYQNKLTNLLLNEDSYLDQFYEGLRIDKSNFFRNLQNCEKFFSIRKKYKSAIGELYKHFKTPLYHNQLPLGLFYGVIGESFAKNLIRGRSNSSEDFQWRSTDSDDVFVNFEKCLMSQGTSNDTSSNSSSQVDKLILQSLSLRTSFRSFENWTAKNRNYYDEINGILRTKRNDLSMEKLFFESFGTGLCETTPLPTNGRLLNAYLGNLKEFAQVFNCPKGSRLNPETVCELL